MKISRSHLKPFLISVLLIGVVGGSLWSFGKAAGSASFSLSPTSGSHDKDTTFTVGVYENSGSETVNAVDAQLTYDSAKLTLLEINTAGSPFTTCPSAPSSSGGTISISCALLGNSVTGNQLVGTLKFQASVGSGSAAVSIASSSHILRSPDESDIWNGVRPSGAYTLTTPATGGGGGGGSGGGSTGGTTGGSTGGTSGGGGSTGTTNKTSTSSTSKTTTSTAAPSAAQQAANPSEPVPVSTPEVSGYLVAIRVTDSKGKIVSGAEVTLNKQTTKSDTTGVASFVNVPAGKQAVAIKSSKGEVKGEVTVSDQKSPTEVQEFALKVKSKSILPLIFEIFGILILLALIFFIIKWLKGKKEPIIKMNTPPEPGKVASSAPPGIVVAPGNTPSPTSTTPAPTSQTGPMSPTVITPTEPPKPEA